MFYISYISCIIFLISIIGLIMTRKHFIVTLMAFELIFLSISLNFIVFSFINDGIMGQAFAVFIMTVAASESAIGLAILVIYYRLKGDISVDFVSTLKG